MPNTYTGKLKLRQPAEGDGNWADEMNSNAQIVEVVQAAILEDNYVVSGLAPSTAAGLVVDYTSGVVVINGTQFSVDAGSKTAADNTDGTAAPNFLYVDSSGVMQISTTPPTGEYAPIAVVDTLSAVITRIGDLRHQRQQAVSPAQLQGQTLAAFTTGGTATAFTLTPAPAIAANAAWLRFRVAFNATAGAAPTLAVSGKSALPLKYYDSSGAKQAVTASQVPSGWVSDVECDGTDWVVQSVNGAGQIKFPATPNLSADANTLDTYEEGTFTGTLTGCTTAPTGTVKYTKIGRLVSLTFLTGGWTATSNSTEKTITGMPSHLYPASNIVFTSLVSDNGGSNIIAYSRLLTTGVLEFTKDANGAGFTASGVVTLQPVLFSYSV